MARAPCPGRMQVCCARLDVRGFGSSRWMSWLRIAFGMLLLATNTVVHVPPLMLAALLKAALPLRGFRRACDRILMAIAASWIGINTTMIRWFTRTRLLVDIDAKLQPQGHYLVLANHQTWV